jgi:hypothetical protein
MRRIAVAALCLSVVFAGCKAKEAADISGDLKEKGTTDLMKGVADDQYEAPQDGKLTEAQVQMYIKVRQQEQKIAAVAKKEAKEHAEKAKAKGEKSLSGMMEGFKTLGSVADLMTADIRAAKELGYNTQEYLWVKGQILAVSGAAMAEKMNEAISANFDAAYAQAKKAHDEATDETTKKMYAEMLAGYDKSRAEMKQQQEDADPAVAHNRALLKKYENEINAWAQELAKYSDEPAEKTQKAVEDWQKQMDEATAKAKQQQ